MKQKQYLLVSMRTNWADELDVEGFLVVSEDYFEAALKRIGDQGPNSYITLGFGTNQELGWHGIGHLTQNLKTTPLTADEAAIFEKHFRMNPGSYHFSGTKREMTDMQRLAFTARHILAGQGTYGFLDSVDIQTY